MIQWLLFILFEIVSAEEASLCKVLISSCFCVRIYSYYISRLQDLYRFGKQHYFSGASHVQQLQTSKFLDFEMQFFGKSWKCNVVFEIILSSAGTAGCTFSS